MDKRKVSYFVDENNGVVVATIKNCHYDAVDFINENFISNVRNCLWFGSTYKHSERYHMQDTYKAIAKCNKEEDAFDVEFGKRLALGRLTDKYHKSLNKRIHNFIEDLDKVLDDAEDYLNKRES